MKSLFSGIFLFCICFVSTAQDFELPTNIKLDKAEDYAKYNTDIVNAVTWLENTPIEEQTDKRTLVSAFLMQWMSGTPTLTISVHAFQVELTEKNPDLLMTFLGAYSKFVIENPSQKEDTLAANVAGFQSLLKVYKNNKGKGIKKDKKVEKLLKLDDVKLKKWVKKQLSS